MKLEELFSKRGDVLEIAELLEMEPDGEVPEELQSMVLILKFMPTLEPDIPWDNIIQICWHDLYQLPLASCHVSILDNAIICFPDAFPCDFEGNTVKFRKPCKIVTYHLGNQYSKYYGKQNQPATTSAK